MRYNSYYKDDDYGIIKDYSDNMVVFVVCKLKIFLFKYVNS